MLRKQERLTEVSPTVLRGVTLNDSPRDAVGHQRSKQSYAGKRQGKCPSNSRSVDRKFRVHLPSPSMQAALQILHS
jgi:hypothetical protein